MNWLMWGEKCSPIFIINLCLNRMHYINCAVNSSLLTLFWLLQKVCGTLDPCFIIAHIIHKEGDLLIYFGVIFHRTVHLKQAHITSGAFVLRAFLWPWQAHSSAFELMILLASISYGPRVAKHFLRPQLVLQPIWGGVISGLSSFLNLQGCIQKFQDSACKKKLKFGYLVC